MYEIVSTWIWYIYAKYNKRLYNINIYPPAAEFLWRDSINAYSQTNFRVDIKRVTFL